MKRSDRSSDTHSRVERVPASAINHAGRFQAKKCQGSAAVKFLARASRYTPLMTICLWASAARNYYERLRSFSVKSMYTSRSASRLLKCKLHCEMDWMAFFDQILTGTVIPGMEFTA